MQPESAPGDVPEVFRVGLACRAKPDHREMSGIDREPEVGNRATPQVREESVRDLDVSAASLADQVAVRRRCEMVSGGAVPKMSMHDNTQALELLEVPVDRRDRDVRCLSLNLRRQLLGGPVPLSLKERTDKKAPRSRHATAGGTHTSEDLLDVSV